MFESNFLFTSKKKASALIVPMVKLCSIKNDVKGKDKFTLHYQVLFCLIHNSLMRLTIFEVILAHVYWRYSTEFNHRDIIDRGDMP